VPRSKEQFEEIRKKTKGNILNAALKLFAEKGYHGTSMNDIANAAKISKGLAYNYFESKQEIIKEIFTTFFEEAGKFIDVMDMTDDPYDKIRLFIEYSFKYFEENEELWTLYISFIFQPEIVEEGKKVTTQFYKSMIEKMENIFISLEIPQPSLEIRFLGALLDGIGLDYFIDKTLFPLQDMKEFLLKRYSKKGIEILKNFN
jgi:AcrR family transcriptional regulator